MWLIEAAVFWIAIIWMVLGWEGLAVGLAACIAGVVLGVLVGVIRIGWFFFEIWKEARELRRD